MSIKVGTAPVSWGIWFSEDEKQMPWDRCMTEMSQAGYKGIELGPWGYFPTEAKYLKEELQKRDMNVVATTLMDDLTSNKTVNKMISILDEMSRIHDIFDVKYVVLIDGLYTDLITGELIRPPKLDDEEMERFISNIIKIRDHAKEHYGLEVLFHPHCQTHIETEEQIEAFLEKTDINLCFDIGHHAYAGGEPIAFMKKHYKRIPYLHIKNCDANVKEQADKYNWPFARAVKEGIMVDPKSGLIDMKAFSKLLHDIEFDGWVIVEQDMYPVPFDQPYVIAKRTKKYLTEIGID